MTLSVLLSVLAAAPSIDVAVGQLCEAAQAPAEFCSVLSQCGSTKKGTCSSDDKATRASDEDWSEWECEVDRKNGYFTCSESVHVRHGPGDGDVLKTQWDAALFVAKARSVVGVVRRGDRPQATFFARDASGWSTVDPLPKLTAATFGLPEPKAPRRTEDSPGFRAEFFVELTLPRIGTSVAVEGRWVNTFRDDSGYGQSDTLVWNEKRTLSWDAVRGRFTLDQRQSR